MPMTADEIKTRILAALPGAELVLTDLVGDNDHWNVVVTSPLFSGKTRIAQHRMVMDAIGSGMGTALHALSVTTKTS